MLSIITVVIILIALIFDFTNGFHDAANAIATTVSTGALKPKIALLLSAVMNILGGLIGIGVAETISKSIVDLTDLSKHLELTIIASGLLGAIIWNLVTWYFGIPSSSSHALIGGLAGAGLAGYLTMNNSIHIFWYKGIVLKVIQPMVTSPVLGFVLGFVLMVIVLNIFKNKPYTKVNKVFKKLQILSASAMSLGHGLQDAQKTMGVVFLCTVAAGWNNLNEPIPLWIKLACATSIGLGTYAGGFKIIKTLGRKIIELDPAKGFVAESLAACLLYINAAFHLPISTTQTITMSIMGVGATKNAHAVKWGVAKNIVIAWILTLPAAGIIAGLLFEIISLPLRIFGVL
jgi:PiT family inorganic phosphate transporter